MSSSKFPATGFCTKLLLAGAILAATARAQDAKPEDPPPEKIQRYLAERQRLLDRLAEKHKEKLGEFDTAIKFVERDLEELTASIRDANRDKERDRAKELKQRAKETRDKLKKLKEDRKTEEADGPKRLKKAKHSIEFTPLLDTDNMRVGDIGRLLFSDRVEVLQVVDERTLRARCQDDEGKPFGASFWLSGFDTSALADGAAFATSTVVEVTDTKSYTTAVGTTRTEFVLEPFDLEQVRPYLPKPEDEEKPEEEP